MAFFRTAPGSIALQKALSSFFSGFRQSIKLSTEVDSFQEGSSVDCTNRLRFRCVVRVSCPILLQSPNAICKVMVIPVIVTGFLFVVETPMNQRLLFAILELYWARRHQP